MTVAGKAVTAWFYDRQGMMEAQRFPDDYDGINAVAPAVNWDRFVMADHWPQVVMRQERNLMTQCEPEAFRTAAVAACDLDDRVADRIIGDPATCRYDPRALVGTTIEREGRQVERVLGGPSEVDKFFRVFLAPGVRHCGGGAVTRDLCRYPLVSRYDGRGDPNAAASYTCARSTSCRRPEP